MSSIASITPARFLPVLIKEPWHNIRKNGFGVSFQGGYSAIITVRETILCTIDFLGRVNPDKTFRDTWADEYDFQQDKMMYVYRSTLHNCLIRLTLTRLGIPVDENALDPLVEAILEYCSDEDEPIPDENEYDDDDSTASADITQSKDSPEVEHTGLHFLPRDNLPDPEDWSDNTLNLHTRKLPLCWGQITAGLAAGITLGAAFFRPGSIAFDY